MQAKIVFSRGPKIIIRNQNVDDCMSFVMMDGKTTAPLKGLIAKLSSVPNAKKRKVMRLPKRNDRIMFFVYPKKSIT